MCPKQKLKQQLKIIKRQLTATLLKTSKKHEKTWQKSWKRDWRHFYYFPTKMCKKNMIFLFLNIFLVSICDSLSLLSKNFKNSDSSRICIPNYSEIFLNILEYFRNASKWGTSTAECTQIWWTPTGEPEIFPRF